VLAEGVDVTPPTYSASEEGDVTDPTLAVQFSEPVNSATSDYVTGVTIKINAVTATISSGVRQGDPSVVHYVITPFADANDAITFEYSDVVGDIADLAGNQLGDVAPAAADNRVGEHLRFDEISDGVHYLTQLL
jgi:hypothetical protein